MGVDDIEKASPSGTHAASLASSEHSSRSSSSIDEEQAPTLEPIRTNHSARSVGSRLDSSDPYENLEHAISATDLETEAERAAREPITYTRTGTSFGSTTSRPPEYEVVFDEGDPENPRNWPLWYRSWVLIAVSFSTWVVVFWSTSYTSSSAGLMEEFDASTTIVTLGVTTYLFGLATGSLVLAPMSELFGRRPVYLVALSLWTILILPCALATSLTEIIVVRFFAAFFGAAMISNGPGTIFDITKPEMLAFAISMWCIAPLNGPVTGPIIGGFVYQYLGWRWENWMALILGGAAVLCMITVRETYHPAILKRKAARLRKENDDSRYWCQYDVKLSTWHLVKVNLYRPVHLFLTEPILWFMNLWVSVVYGILYLCFVAYPIVFSDYRGWSPSIGGLAFLGLGIGNMIIIVGEPVIRRIVNRQPRDPETGGVRPEAPALVMAIGGVLAPLGQLVFSWTCVPTSIPWAIPVAFGIPFGMGNTLVFIYTSNYLTGAYGIYAASALAGNAVLRSIFGGALPLAGPKMYASLGPNWAGTLLGLLEAVLIPIPFFFWRHGHKIRSKSRMIRQLREEQERVDAKRAKGQARVERRQQRALEKEANEKSSPIFEDPEEEQAQQVDKQE